MTNWAELGGVGKNPARFVALDGAVLQARRSLPQLERHARYAVRGNQQKVVIGRWQSAPCRLLLLDEPFQGVDVGARRDIVDPLRADRHDGATIIPTSDVEEAIEAADIVAIMCGQSIVGLHDLRTSTGESLISAIAALETIEPDNEREEAA
jgi:ABC-type sugar transport system ATPase subunit